MTSGTVRLTLLDVLEWDIVVDFAVSVQESELPHFRGSAVIDGWTIVKYVQLADSEFGPNEDVVFLPEELGNEDPMTCCLLAEAVDKYIQNNYDKVLAEVVTAS